MMLQQYSGVEVNFDLDCLSGHFPDFSGFSQLHDRLTVFSVEKVDFDL